jgi:hypothetical protein
MTRFAAAYTCVGVITAMRAAWGMWKVRGWVAGDVDPRGHGIVYVGMLVSSVAMGVCWWLYWPAMLASYFAWKHRQRNEDEGEEP